MTPAAGKFPRALIYVMMALVIITMVLARFHYRRENRAVDPRIVPARKLYEGYNALAAANDYAGVINLLDTIEHIYRQIPHYAGSFEICVLENNRAAVYLTLGLSYDSLSSPFHFMGQDSLMALGESAARKSISGYEEWQKRYEGKDERAIRQAVQSGFGTGFEPYLDNRIGEITKAIEETPRRLSVSYTNLGLAYRYREDYQEAASCYQQAIDLWEDNLTAENNLNILLGRPLKKRNFLQKMFPKSK